MSRRRSLSVLVLAACLLAGPAQSAGKKKRTAAKPRAQAGNAQKAPPDEPGFVCGVDVDCVDTPWWWDPASGPIEKADRPSNFQDISERVFKKLMTEYKRGGPLPRYQGEAAIFYVNANLLPGGSMGDSIPGNNETNPLPLGRVRLSRDAFYRTANEDEFAYIVSHEIVHLVDRHVEKKRDAIVALLKKRCRGERYEEACVETQRKSVREKIEKDLGLGFEQRADAMGMEYMHKVGYDTESVSRLWRRYVVAECFKYHTFKDYLAYLEKADPGHTRADKRAEDAKAKSDSVRFRPEPPECGKGDDDCDSKFD